MFAILEDAVRVLRQPQPDTLRRRRELRRDREEVVAWLDGHSAQIPFEYVCAALEVEPDYLRRCMKAQIPRMQREWRRGFVGRPVRVRCVA